MGTLAAFAMESYMCYRILATKSLKAESMPVYRALMAGNLPEARKKLSWIVGRDTEPLDEQGVARAAVETVSENTSDGVIAPMLFMVIGGALMWVERARRVANLAAGQAQSRQPQLRADRGRLRRGVGGTTGRRGDLPVLPVRRQTVGREAEAARLHCQNPLARTNWANVIVFR
jgi:hypothetical protein